MNDELLKKIYELEKENNKLLKSQRRKDIFSFLFKLIKWLVIIYILYYVWVNYVGPSILFLNQLTNSINNTTQSIKQYNIDNIDLNSIENMNPLILENLKSKLFSN